MIYATFAQLLGRYSERDLRFVTDPEAQAVNEPRATQALQDASEELDAYLSKRYVLPLVDLADVPIATVPSVLIRCTCDVAVYRLQVLRTSDDVEDARKRYEDVLSLLKKMGNGDVLLPGIKTLADAKRHGGLSPGLPVFGSPPSLFGREVR